MSKSAAIVFCTLLTVTILSATTYEKPSTQAKTEAKTVQQVQKVEGKDVKQIQNTQEEIQMPKYNVPLSDSLYKYTYDLCQEKGIKFEIMLGLMWQESGFNERAVNKNKNKSSDSGLCQLNSTLRSYHASRAGVSLKKFDAFNSYMNVSAAMGHLEDLYTTWRNVGISEDKIDWYCLASYNQGVNGYKKYIKKYGYKTKYAKNIINYANKLKGER